MFGRIDIISEIPNYELVSIKDSFKSIKTDELVQKNIETLSAIFPPRTIFFKYSILYFDEIFPSFFILIVVSVSCLIFFLLQ